MDLEKRRSALGPILKGLLPPLFPSKILRFLNRVQVQILNYESLTSKQAPKTPSWTSLPKAAVANGSASQGDCNQGRLEVLADAVPVQSQTDQPRKGIATPKWINDNFFNGVKSQTDQPRKGMAARAAATALI